MAGMGPRRQGVYPSTTQWSLSRNQADRLDYGRHHAEHASVVYVCSHMILPLSQYYVTRRTVQEREAAGLPKFSNISQVMSALPDRADDDGPSSHAAPLPASSAPAHGTSPVASSRPPVPPLFGPGSVSAANSGAAAFGMSASSAPAVAADVDAPSSKAAATGTAAASTGAFLVSETLCSMKLQQAAHAFDPQSIVWYRRVVVPQQCVRCALVPAPRGTTLAICLELLSL